MFAVQSAVTMISTGEIYEDTYHSFECEVAGGIPYPVAMMWYHNDQTVDHCEMQALDSPCVLLITRADHQSIVRCQEFQIEYKEGGSAQQTLNVLCRCM